MRSAKVKLDDGYNKIICSHLLLIILFSTLRHLWYGGLNKQAISSPPPPPTTTVVWLSFTQAGYSNTKLLTVVGLGFFGFFLGGGGWGFGFGVFLCVFFGGFFQSVDV